MPTTPEIKRVEDRQNLKVNLSYTMRQDAGFLEKVMRMLRSNICKVG